MTGATSRADVHELNKAIDRAEGLFSSDWRNDSPDLRERNRESNKKSMCGEVALDYCITGKYEEYDRG